jgi:hypothetical protein
MRPCCAAVLLALVLAPAAGASAAGRIEGRVRNQLDNGYPHLRVFANLEGADVHYTTVTDDDGSFAFDNIAEGTYALASERPSGALPGYVAAVEVGGNGVEHVDMRIDSAYAIPAGEQRWGRTVRVAGQTFVANGRSIVGASVRADSPSTLRLRIKVGGPNGAIISPLSLTVVDKAAQRYSVTWRPGSVATVPGKKYYLEALTADGSPWSCYISVMGDAYRSGTLYLDGQSDPDHDLSATVFCDSAQHPAAYLQWSPGEQGVWADEIGQIFVATGECLLAAACYARAEEVAEPLVLVYTVHEDGPNGRQVGCSKTSDAPPGTEHAVAWLPGEVTLEPGRRYYLRLKSASGERILCYLISNDYRFGHAVIDGKAEWGRDLAGWMLQWHPSR